MVKSKDIKEVYTRTKGFCECGCGKHFDLDADYPDGFGFEYHHIYFKSQYRKADRNESRNLAFLYGPHHKPIHEGNAPELDERLKHEADERKPPEERTKKKIRRNKIVYGGDIKKYDKEMAKKIIAQSIDYFKKDHDGLSPSQYAYRKQKLYIDNMKNAKKHKR